MLRITLILLCLFIGDWILHAQANEQISAETQYSNFIFRNNGDLSNNGSQVLLGHKRNGFVGYYLDASNGDFSGFDYAFLKHNDDLSLELVNLTKNSILFKTGGNNIADVKLSISSNGNVGIGNSNANAKLQVTNGDIYIENISKGVIMKSPGGQCWRMTIDNTGIIITSPVICP